MPRKVRAAFILEGQRQNPEIAGMLDRLCILVESLTTNRRRRQDLQELCQMIFAKSSWVSPNVEFDGSVVSRAFRTAVPLDDKPLIEHSFPLVFSSPEYLTSVNTMVERHGILWLKRR
jgi:hypothetical protein